MSLRVIPSPIMFEVVCDVCGDGRDRVEAGSLDQAHAFIISHGWVLVDRPPSPTKAICSICKDRYDDVARLLHDPS